MAHPDSPPALALGGIAKHYGYVKALDGVDFHVNAGEIVSLLGDNGAGKSTLLKVMSGAHAPSEGTIRIDGKLVTKYTPSVASDLGVEMVYQDLALVDTLDISTNLQLGREPLRPFPLSLFGFVDFGKMHKATRTQLDKLGVRTAPPERAVEMLSGGQRQVTAISRAAVRLFERGGGVILMDEPTAALGYEQTLMVEALIKRMAAAGFAIVLVTHNLPLCLNVSDRIVVLNRGRKVADVMRAQADHNKIVSWITGADRAEEAVA
ncbi:Galactose/methyl galactoside import ATP-binding protein MglA [Aquimixticola soesokkakensis]|uniref:Galactose/methyl galactoside import ATP-binding protein MglA n=1 Tax=Aquimixticola soesokkakensis TaxID=1519096 RepID=A0A1Y5TEQ4_9RHOB|nr:ATP-binding cassette domain-containing protein [Aquimixticola soesokkakensis]SLN60253.1 Galactose/methyl galactoside import ATP-binding protein MglA [Aquimixticola soesokkakensis]